MGNPVGDIGSKIVGEMAGIAKQVTKDLGKLSGDVLTKSVEDLTMASSQPQNPAGGGTNEANKGANDPTAAAKAQKAARDRSAIARVQQELEQYRQKKAAKDRQKMQLQMQEQQEQQQIKKMEKNKKESRLSRFFKSIKGTGEADRQKG